MPSKIRETRLAGDAAAQIHLDPARLFQVARGGLPAGRRVAVEYSAGPQWRG